MRNTLKKTVKQLQSLVIVPLLLCFFAGCSDAVSTDGNTTATAEKVCVVRGEISVGDALPAAVANMAFSTNNSENAGVTASSRTATSSFDMDNITSQQNRGIIVSASRGSDVIDGSVEIANGKITYTLYLTSIGKWNVTFRLQASTDDSSEETTWVDILYKSIEIEVNNDFTANGPAVLLEPSYIENTSGAISLNITDDSGKIASVSYYAEKYLISKTNSLAEVNTVEFENGVAKITRDSVAADNYGVVFSFNDAAGNVLYKCRENISVFSGFVTDTWFGVGNHLVAENGAVEFKVTDDLITAFGTETVPKTQMVLYKQTETGYNYYFTNDATEKISGKTADMVPFEAGNNSFCFDSAGNIYAIQDYNSEDGATIVKNGSDLATISPTLSADLKAITVDTKNDILYGFAFTSGNVFTLYKYTSLISTFSESAKDTSATIYSVSCGNLFTDEDDTLPCYASVHDGIAYVLLAPERYSSDDTKYHVYYPRAKLLVFSLSDATKGDEPNYFTFSASSALATLYDLNLSNRFDISDENEIFEITDMLYQDGNVYMLVRYVSLENSAIYSTGSVVRFNLWSGAVMTPGFGEPFDTSSAKFYIYNGGERMYNSAGATNPVLCSYNTTLSPEICVPATKTSGLYGPSKFIAIKPKKLVIADEGYAVYTNDDGALSYKNVNRVVTVDLEDFAIVSDETDCTFGTDSTTAVITKIMSSMDNGNFFIVAGLSGSLYNSIGSTFGTSAGSKFAYGVNLSE